MQIRGKTTIFANAHESMNGTWYTYATGVSSKKQDGSYVNAYLDVRFRNGVVVENKTKIDIKDGFLTVKEYTKNGGETVKKLELMVLDFELVDGGAGHYGSDEPSGYTALSDDVPF